MDNNEYVKSTDDNIIDIDDILNNNEFTKSTDYIENDSTTYSAKDSYEGVNSDNFYANINIELPTVDEPSHEDIATRLETKTAQDIAESMSQEELSEALSSENVEDDWAEIDEETISLVRTFLTAEAKFRSKLFQNERISKFHEEIHKIVKPSILIRMGKQRLEMLENGQVSENDLEFVEAEIIILFTQILELRKQLERSPEIINNEKPKNPPYSYAYSADEMDYVPNMEGLFEEPVFNPDPEPKGLTDLGPVVGEPEPRVINDYNPREVPVFAPDYNPREIPVQAPDLPPERDNYPTM